MKYIEKYLDVEIPLTCEYTDEFVQVVDRDNCSNIF
jgi:hypothetical protein